MDSEDSGCSSGGAGGGDALEEVEFSMLLPVGRTAREGRSTVSDL